MQQTAPIDKHWQRHDSTVLAGLLDTDLHNGLTAEDANLRLQRFGANELPQYRQRSLLRLGLLSNRPLLGAVLLTCALQLAVIYLPWANAIFHTQPLTLAELALCSSQPCRRQDQSSCFSSCSSSVWIRSRRLSIWR